MKRFLLVCFAVLGLLGTNYPPSAARETRQGDQCVVAQDEVINGNLFVLCRTLVVAGRVNGNLMGAATTAQLKGTVTGAVYLLAGQLDVEGLVGKNLHFAGPVLRLQPTARFEDTRADLLSASLSTVVADGASIPGSITDVGYQLVVHGQTGGEINFWGSALTLNGQIGGDVDATVGDPESTGISQLQTLLIPFSWDVELINPGLVVSPRGQIAGDLRYAGPTGGRIDGAVSGQTMYTPVIVQPTLTQIISEEQGGLRLYLSQVIREFITLAIIGLLALAFLPRPLQQALRTLQARSLPSIGLGLLAFILSFPIILIFLLFSILIVFMLSLLQLESLVFGGGILLAITNLGGATIFYFVAIFISRVIVGLAMGRLVVRLAVRDESTPRAAVISLLVGLALLALAGSLPVIGWVVNAVVVFLGLGAVLIVLQAQLRSYRDGAPASIRVTPILVKSGYETPVFPPPMLDDGPKTPGMDNLPPGFKWWDD
jgi:hypothetical protein